jgi:hypothetical protein
MREYDAMAKRVEGLRVQVSGVKVLMALDERIRAIRLSGYTYADLLNAAAAQLPARAWFEQIHSANGGVEIDGRAGSLDAVVSLDRAFHDGRFGVATLEKVDRVELPPNRAAFDFALSVARI